MNKKKAMRRSTAIAALIVLFAVTVFLGWYAFDTLRRTVKDDNGIKLGLDLAGGVSITYEVVGDTPTSEEMQDTITKLQQRIENDLSAESSTTEESVYKVGDRRIAVEIPGVKDANAILEELGTPGNLYFIKHYASDGTTENYSIDSSTGTYKLADGVTIDSLKADGSIVLEGSEVKDAQAGYNTDQTTGSQSPVVELTLTKEGTTAFAAATKEAYNNNQDTIGIYYDGAFISVPSVNAEIDDGNAVITGMSDIDEANRLASNLRIGGLDIELKEIQSEVVSAQLGSNALLTSLLAAGIGLLVVIVFMIIAYRLPGVCASLALILYTELLIGIIDQFDITLTLPGIAGIILSIGMAVDANAIIFARIKEEISAGKTVHASILSGFSKALSAILDGNATTIIAALVLIIAGSGTVKGFAITLIIGTLLSLFTALAITRLYINSFYAVGARNEKLYGRKPPRRNLKFISKRWAFFGISLAVIATGLITMAVRGAGSGRALNYSLEFLGGTSTTVAVDKDYTVDEIEQEIVPLVSAVTGDSNVQTQKVDQDNSIIIKTRTLDLDERESLAKSLEDNLGVTEDDITTESFSSTISGEMRQQSILAVLIAVGLMLIYIWFRFRDIRFGASAVIALAHDVLVTLAVYAVFRLSVGSTFIACILTIVGYSINDTIVIFDRIRENLKALPENQRNKASLRELCDRSITETLSRSLSTSFTTVIMVIMLLIFGVATIREFAFPLTVGVICGTYSSICIATELWFVMHTHGKHAVPDAPAGFVVYDVMADRAPEKALTGKGASAKASDAAAGTSADSAAAAGSSAADSSSGTGKAHVSGQKKDRVFANSTPKRKKRH